MRLNALLAVALLPAVLQAAEPAKFIRVVKDEEGKPKSLETAIATYDNGKGFTVDLVGAVHIGDKDYYKKLNQRLSSYNAVLYELVVEHGAELPPDLKNRKKDNPISMFQGLTKEFLELESQTEQIDYTPANFVHADMTFEEMADAMRKRGDTPLTLALGVILEMMKQQNLQQQAGEATQPESEAETEGESLEQVLTALLDPERAVKMKQAMAQQFDAQDPAKAFGSSIGALLIEDRNKKAIEVLKKEMAKRNQGRLALFYGAAHLPDFEKRLVEDLGMKKTETTWLRAWDIRTREQLKRDADKAEQKE